MDFIAGIALIICGILCIPSVLIAKRPDAKEILDKIAPYQGIIGIVICAWGVINIIFWFMGTQHFYSIGARGVILWISGIFTSVLSALVGFLLGFGLLQRSALKNASDETRAKLEQIHGKLASAQNPLGIASIIGGGWMVVFSFVYYLM